VALEGTGSYGANLARNLHAAGIKVCDVRPPKREARAGKGKSDEIDAVAAARAALVSGTTHLAAPRADGIRSALRVLLVGRRAMDTRRTADRNALTALLCSFDLGVDVRGPVTDAQIRSVAAWRSRSTDDAAAATIRDEARRLASSLLELTHSRTIVTTCPGKEPPRNPPMPQAIHRPPALPSPQQHHGLTPGHRRVRC
jgi:transposase